MLISGSLILIIAAVGIWLARSNSQPPKLVNSVTTKHAHATSVSQKPMGTPAVLRIPKLGISAKVQPVGLNPQGNMGAPRSLADVAWYKEGPAPGSTGNAVIAGHFGKPHQTAFWNLESLDVGDRIEVTDANNTVAQFKVTQTQRVKPDLKTRDQIFGKTDQAHLNLITCDGVWNKASKSYDERLIVFSTRVN